MQHLIALLALVAVSYALVNPNSAPAVDESLVQAVQASGAPWKASLNKFANVTLADAKHLLGAKLGRPEGLDMPTVDTVVGAIPAAFDARSAWPGAIQPIRDQGGCGSCWAFGVVEALGDRFAIVTNGTTNVVLSPQELVSCDTQYNLGCNGGYLSYAWQYVVKSGVVSDACYPYSSGNGVTGTCQLTSATCPSGKAPYVNYYAANSYYITPSVAAIQTEILTNGPIEVGFDVYQDFFSYTSGVYIHTTGALAGGHAVKMIGWGTLNGVAYWICANSWGVDWGQDGFFLIQRGVDQCGIESDCYAGLPDTTSL